MSRMLVIAFFAAFVAGVYGQDETCPLCGEFPVTQPPPEPNVGFAEFDFDICCPYSENNVGGCVLNPLGEAERVSSLDAPIIAPDEEFVGFCQTWDQFVFETTDTQSCCVTCSCFGDPNCIDFNGQKDTWIVCDGRTVPENPIKQERGFCKITEEQCLKEIDPSSDTDEPCLWLPQSESEAKNWDIRTMGSPCQARGLTPLLMYEADTFAFSIFSGDRGYIKELAVTFGDDTWTMSAQDCVLSSTPWRGPQPIPPTFQRRVETCAPDGNNDVLWDVVDPETGIGSTIRCTSTKVFAAKRQPYMNVESLYEPDPNYETDRNPLGGFCATGEMGNSNPSPNTINIEENGFCFQNAPETNVTIARLICQNPSITRQGVGQCQKDFCTKYNQPLYDDFEDCYETIQNSFAEGFCRAFNADETDVQECLTMIQEEGWAQAVAVYLNRNRPTTGCIDNFDELPDDLEPCQKGVRLQYLDPESGAWVTVKAIALDEPVCADASFELCFDEFPQLFNNRVRWQQERQVVGCLADQCLPEIGFATRLRTEKTTLAPTFQPTEPPSSAPTESPTVSPTTPEPTPEPTLEPSNPEPPAPPTLSPTIAVLCPEENRVPLDIANSQIRYNNLGGAGPQTDDECKLIWFSNVMTLNDILIDGVPTNNVVVDLVMANLTEYRPSNFDPTANDGVSNNGKFFELGQINLKCMSFVGLEFIFVRNGCTPPGGPCSVVTDTSCDIVPNGVEGDGLILTTYDLDQFRDNKNKERVEYCNVNEPLEVEGSLVEIETVNTGNQFCGTLTRFTSTTFGTEADNPTVQALEDLTPVQRQKLGRVLLEPGLSRIFANYSLTGPDPANFNPRCGRRILYSADYCDLEP